MSSDPESNNTRASLIDVGAPIMVTTVPAPLTVGSHTGRYRLVYRNKQYILQREIRHETYATTTTMFTLSGVTIDTIWEDMETIILDDG